MPCVTNTHLTTGPVLFFGQGLVSGRPPDVAPRKRDGIRGVPHSTAAHPGRARHAESPRHDGRHLIAPRGALSFSLCPLFSPLLHPLSLLLAPHGTFASF